MKNGINIMNNQFTKGIGVLDGIKKPYKNPTTISIYNKIENLIKELGDLMGVKISFKEYDRLYFEYEDIVVNYGQQYEIY